MSIIYSEIKETVLTRKMNKLNDGKLSQATIDEKTRHKLAFPSDYNFSKCYVPQKFKDFGEQIHNFKIRPDDVWIVGFAKTGSTWIHDIAWQLKNNLKSPTAKHNIEFGVYNAMYVDSVGRRKRGNFDVYENLPSPHIFKSHLPAHLLPKELWTVRSKMIYTILNPKDTVVSYYQFYKNFFVITETFLMEDLFEAFLNDYYYFGPIHDHVHSFWQLRHLDHVFLCRYEELLNDQFAGIKRISGFLECSYDDEQLQTLTKNVSFQKMKSLDRTELGYFDHRFYRKRRAGSYRDEMSAEYIRKFDEWNAERLKNTDFKFADV